MAPESMADLLRTWDGEDVVVRFDRPTGSWILIAIHSTRLGPAGGGTRMKSYPDPAAARRDAMCLASAMAATGDEVSAALVMRTWLLQRSRRGIIGAPDRFYHNLASKEGSYSQTLPA